MAVIKAQYANIEEIPTAYLDLFEEGTDGVWRLTGVDGIMLADDHAKLRKALDDAREERGALAAKLRALQAAVPEGVDADGLRNTFARVNELEDALKAANSTRQEAIDAAVKERIGPREREFESQISALKAAINKITGERDDAVGKITRQTFETMVRSAVAPHVVETAVPDVIYRATSFGWQIDKDNELVAVKPSGERKYSLRDPTVPITFAEWVDSILPKEAPHVLKQPVGTGEKGGFMPAGINTKRWSAMTSAEKAAAVAAAAAEGGDALRNLQTRMISQNEK